MSSSRPWWASDGPVDGGVDPAEDPLDVHRAARRGSPQDARSSSPHEPCEGSESMLAAEVCGACPICATARTLGEARPELVAHLLEAGRHLTAAIRAMVDPSGDRSDDGSDEDPDDDRVRRIDLD